MKKEELCECGHDRIMHDNRDDGECYDMANNGLRCSCEKFKPQTISLTGKRVGMGEIPQNNSPQSCSEDKESEDEDTGASKHGDSDSGSDNQKESLSDKITRRPYKNQKQKDKELMLAYQKGLIDGRKEGEEKVDISKLEIDGFDHFIEWRQDKVKIEIVKQITRIKKDVKEKIQNAQRRLKELGAKKHKYPPKQFLEEQDKIFLEEFGKNLI